MTTKNNKPDNTVILHWDECRTSWRELSWQDFNARVLALAEDESQPLLERTKFLAIFASNLDEFYMVRVAGLKRRLSAGLPMRGGDRVSLRNQLEISLARELLEFTWITHFGALIVIEALPVSCNAAWAVGLSAITQ